MCIVYGRRRIGKTTLINEFIRGKEHIAFTAIKGSAERNIELFGEVVVDYFMPGINGVRFTDIKDILNFITNNIGDKKLVLVIDELPYLAEADKEFLSLLQVEIDKNWLNKNIFLILSGSSISFMEQEVLSSKSPIYGRRTMQIDLKPFNYLETALFVPDYSCEEKAICYGITGGVAKYISMFDSDKSLDDNIADLYFNPSGFMYEEPRNLLVQEFRNATVYDDVVSAIANGANKVVEIRIKLIWKVRLSTIFFNICWKPVLLKRHMQSRKRIIRRKSCIHCQMECLCSGISLFRGQLQQLRLIMENSII